MGYKQISILLVVSTMLLVSTARADVAEDSVRRASALIVEGHQAEAEKLLRSAAERGNLSAAAMLGAMLSYSERNTEAIKVLEPAANKGNIEAQWYLSQAYALKAPPDFERSNFWLHRAARAGFSKAKILLQDQTDLTAGPDGKVSTRALAESIRTIISAKANSLSEEALQCYRMSRTELIAAFNAAIGECFQALPKDQHERIVSSLAVTRSLASCTNDRVFERAGTSRAELVQCLPRK